VIFLKITSCTIIATKKEEGRGKKEEGRRKKEEGRGRRRRKREKEKEEGEGRGNEPQRHRGHRGSSRGLKLSNRGFYPSLLTHYGVISTARLLVKFIIFRKEYLL
jgi:hypothetical protein